MAHRRTTRILIPFLLGSFAVAVLLLPLASCNMVQGLGTDITEASRATEEFIGGNPDD